MGIVADQSSKNIVVIVSAFVIGAINALFLYPAFLQAEYYGLIIYLLSAANILTPLIAFGVQNTIIKFFSAYAEKEQRDYFLTFVIFLPLLIIIPMGFLGVWFYESISTYFSIKNPIIKDYTYTIFLVAICAGYFEIFYAWVRVQLQSVFGNFVREIFMRIVVALLLTAVYFHFITKEEFIYYLVTAYFIRLIIMMWYALKLYKPKLKFALPDDYKKVLTYMFYIILAGSAGSILIDIDKVMIPQKEVISETAYYAVAVFIATIIEVPGRAMFQIINPIAALELNRNNLEEIKILYKKSSINLLIVSGLIFLLVNLNINTLYELMPEKNYAGAILVVFMISLAKLFNMILGINNTIISNSKYYKATLWFSLLMAISVYYLNDELIERMGINGAALSTLIVVFIFNWAKIWYVKAKFNFQLFTIKTAKVLSIIIVLFSGFYFLDFAAFHPIINIGLKSIIISICYCFIMYKLKFSDDLNRILNKYIAIVKSMWTTQ